MLAADLLSELIERYLNEVPCPSFFDVPEACAFLDFLDAEGRLPEVPHIKSVRLLERALLVAAAESAFPASERRAGESLRWQPGAALIPFAGDVNEVLSAVWSGQGLPPPGQATTAIVAAGLPGRCRAAMPLEISVAMAAHGGLSSCAQRDLDQGQEGLRLALDELIAIRFLG